MTTIDVDPRPDAAPSSARPAKARLRAFALAAGLLAGIVSGLAGEAAYGRFQVSLTASAGIPTASETAASGSSGWVCSLSSTR